MSIDKGELCRAAPAGGDLACPECNAPGLLFECVACSHSNYPPDSAPAGGDVDSRSFEREEELVAQGWVRSEPPALCPHGGEYDEHGGCPMCWRDCRAGEHHWQPLEHCKSCGEIRQADSAPAGSGEVEELADHVESIANSLYRDERNAERLRTAAALLRKLQQGAEHG